MMSYQWRKKTQNMSSNGTRRAVFGVFSLWFSSYIWLQSQNGTCAQSWLNFWEIQPCLTPVRGKPVTISATQARGLTEFTEGWLHLQDHLGVNDRIPLEGDGGETVVGHLSASKKKHHLTPASPTHLQLTSKLFYASVTSNSTVRIQDKKQHILQHGPVTGLINSVFTVLFCAFVIVMTVLVLFWLSCWY